MDLGLLSVISPLITNPNIWFCSSVNVAEMASPAVGSMGNGRPFIKLIPGFNRLSAAKRTERPYEYDGIVDSSFNND